VDKLQSLKLGFRPVLGCDFIRLALNREHAVILEHHKQKKRRQDAGATKPLLILASEALMGTESLPAAFDILIRGAEWYTSKGIVFPWGD